MFQIRFPSERARKVGVGCLTAAGRFGFLTFPLRRPRFRAGAGVLLHDGFDAGAIGFDKALELFGGRQQGEVAETKSLLVMPAVA